MANESVWLRGWRDTKAAWANWRFLLLEAVVGPVSGFVAGIVWNAGIGFAVSIGIVVFGLLAAWIGATSTVSKRQHKKMSGIAADPTLMLRFKVLEVIQGRGDQPIDLPELMEYVGLEHGNAEANKLANDAIRWLDTTGEIVHVRHGSAHGWVAIKK